jgi:predicted amidophosphoribosyltransferase
VAKKNRSKNMSLHEMVTVVCGFCGNKFPESEGIRGCGRCGVPGRCHMVRCPLCFYENPLEPNVVKKLKKLMKK